MHSGHAGHILRVNVSVKRILVKREVAGGWWGRRGELEAAGVGAGEGKVPFYFKTVQENKEVFNTDARSRLSHF